MRLAVEEGPNDWEAHFGLGICLHTQGKDVEAVERFQRALELNADDRHCLANLLSCQLELGNIDAAEKLARRAVEIHDSSAVAWSNLGVVLDRQDRYEEAIDAFSRSNEISPRTGEPHAFVNHAIALLRAARTREGIELLESKLKQFPNVQGHCHYALALLLSGRLVEGWEQYEFRWIEGPLRASRPAFVKPSWSGQDLAGKTILLRAEQGFGDFFQFIRYARHVKALGATVLLQLHESLRHISKWVEGVDHVLEVGEPYGRLDYYANLMSLPRVFGTELSNIPASVPYLAVDPDRRARWKAHLGKDDALKIGIAWAGSPTHLRDNYRSVPLDVLQPLGDVQGVKFYSVQKGAAAAEARVANRGFDVIDLEDELRDFTDTAALINELDLVICVDTSVAHLAGALGKPVWMMISSPCDWRWLETGDTCAWYPTMTLFRQTKQGDWDGVVARMAEALRHVRAGLANLTRAPATEVTPSLTPRMPEWRDIGLSAAIHSRVGFLQYLPSQPDVGESIRVYGEFLQRHLDMLATLVRPGDCVLEMGTGVGVHAVFLGAAIGPTGHLMLYESRREMEQLLRQNLAANGIINHTILKTRARGTMSDGIASTSMLDAETLDELRLEKLDLLKINDGCDCMTIIDGSLETIWRLRPSLFCAVPDEDVFRVLADRVREFGYRTWRVATPLFNPDNFHRIREDIFAGREIVALLAIPEEVHVDLMFADSVETS
jgi:hypothetical protein